MANNTSPHILNTSATLLGFCLFVITSLRISNQAENSNIDEFTSVIAIVFVFSCLFSFLSIRTSNLVLEKQLETMADRLFIIALSGILIIIMLISFNFIK
ncbi:hypothetical protein [Flavobacterium kingsejongi]|uniref:Uncharacterized protein n=1 Tax=Flavobacterium kingsejongi TaxID=1678728 RepID=A0A2S1LPX3_9FLAO|nr:hypothetical protein [Flavobacterium kingsejongi]AWG25794.1 hypothetical protein FK004_11450 [Flavobacterium kingsejongi]